MGKIVRASTPYGVAVCLVLLAFLLRYTAYDDLDNRFPFAFFMPAILLAAWYGGMGPGLFAVATGVLLGDYFFLPPHRSFGPLTHTEKLAISMFALTAVLGVVLFEHLHTKIRELKRRLDGTEDLHQLTTKMQ